MIKNPENYFMCLGKYAYDPFIKGDAAYVRVTHRGTPIWTSVVKVLASNMGYTCELITSTMPSECIREFSETLQRNLSFLMRWGLNA